MAQLRFPVEKEDHQKGKRDAEITLVEYGDYLCSHCAAAHPQINQLIEEMNSLLFVFRNFPLTQSHPEAMNAARAAEAAGLQDHFWQMHDWIFEHRNEINEESLFSSAQSLQLNMNQFANDFNSEVVTSEIEKDFETGVRSGVNRTPTFFLNGNRINNYDETYESLLQAVKEFE